MSTDVRSVMHSQDREFPPERLAHAKEAAPPIPGYPQPLAAEVESARLLANDARPALLAGGTPRCLHRGRQPLHARGRHPPPPTRCNRVLPFHHVHADLAAGRLPTVVFVTPDLHHEMRSGPVRVADTCLQRLVGELEAAPV